VTSASPKIPVSCFVITRNEEDVLDTALRSVAELVGEIVVVDSGSSDRTVAIARSYGARVIERAWPGFGPQKRFAERACRNDWVLNLDADEALSPELAQEIRALFAAGGPTRPFYALPRALVYPGRSSPALARRDRPVRLFDRRQGGFSDSVVHEGVAARRAQTGRLRHPILHFAARSMLHLTTKNLSYAGLNATRPTWRKRGLLELYARLLLEFPAVFIRTYLFRGHALNGAQGFALAVSVAFCSFMKIVAQIESRGAWLEPGSGFKRLPERSGVNPATHAAFVAAERN
jgi:glycosyltransferase involved in cell wall biosynthesis